jgi:alpha-glucosidase
MTASIPYLMELGVDATWVSPFFKSAGKDGGYDIADYQDTDHDVGDIEELKVFLAAAKQSGLRTYADLVVSHTADTHPWFDASRSDKGDQTYIWHPGIDGRPPNNWLSVFPRREGDKAFAQSAWQWDAKRGEYFMHNFGTNQPNLNHDNPGVRELIKEKVIRHLLRLGFDGFRADAVYYMAHDPQFRDEARNPYYVDGKNTIYTQLQRERSMGDPLVYDYLREYAKVLNEPEFAGRGLAMMLEAYPRMDRRDPEYDPVPGYREFYNRLPSNVAPFYFELATWDANTPAKVHQKAIDDFMALHRPGELMVWPLGNHDKPRIASRLGMSAARGAAVLQMSLPGSVVIYQGDEYGQENVSAARGLQDRHLGRDVARTPMHWNAGPNAGFSRASPEELFLPVGADYREVNIEAQRNDPGSMLSLYKGMIRARKEVEALGDPENYGKIESPHPDVVTFAREAKDGERAGTVLVLANYGNQELQLNMQHAAAKGTRLLSSAHVIEPAIEQPFALDEIRLAPHETLLIRTD